MSKTKTFAGQLFSHVVVDCEKGIIVEAAYGIPRLFKETDERGETDFEELLNAAFETLKPADVRELKKYAKTDEMLEKAFQRVYKEKLMEVELYKVD